MGDARSIVSVLDHLYNDSAVQAAYCDFVLTLAVSMMRDHWPIVVAIVKELMGNQELNGASVAAIIERVQSSARWQTHLSKEIDY